MNATTPPFAAGPFGAVFIVWGLVVVLFASLVASRWLRDGRRRRRADSARSLRAQVLDYTTGLGDTGAIEGLPIRASAPARATGDLDEVDFMLYASGLLTKVTGESPRRRLRALLSRQGMDDRALRWIRSRRTSRRALAAEYLARAGGPDAVPHLLRALEDRQRGVRVAAAYGLVHVATPDVGRRLLEACAGPHGIPRIFASDVAVKMGPAVAEAVAGGLAHPSRQVRMVAIDAAGGLGLVETVPRLEEFVFDRRHDRDVALRAVVALGLLGQDRSTAAIAECLSPSSSPAIRRAGFAALGGIETNTACEILATHLDGEPDIARHAAEALSGTASGRRTLTLHAAGESPRARAAAWGLWSRQRQAFIRANLPLTDEDYLPIRDQGPSRRGPGAAPDRAGE